MSSLKKTYRLFSLFMAFLIAISISIPADVIAAHCHGETAEMSADHCPVSAGHQHEGDTHSHGNDQSEDCDWILSCGCDIHQTEVKPEAVPSISKTAKIFVVSVIQFLDSEPKATPAFSRDTDLASHTEFPSIFLLNSAFLN